MQTNLFTKQQAFDLFEAKRKEFLEYARWWAGRIYKEKGNVTIDDVRDKVNVPQELDARVCGAVFNKSEWEKVGYTSTLRKTSHGRPIAVYKLKEN